MQDEVCPFVEELELGLDAEDDEQADDNYVEGNDEEEEPGLEDEWAEAEFVKGGVRFVGG